MKRNWTALALALCLLCAAASADTISFSGTVEASEALELYLPGGVTVDRIPVKAGETVQADTVIAQIRTTKYYAEEDGVITAVFGEAGEDAEVISNRYGAVMYLEGQYVLSISATTSRAYEVKENYIVHAGEEVYLVSRKTTTNRGRGLITSVDGTSYTVLVTEGDFLMGDSIDIMRESTYALTSRIGRGNIARVSPTAVTGAGTLVNVAVKAGDSVKRGQLLFETVEGAYDGLSMNGADILAGTEGVISKLGVSQGASLQQSGVLAEIYPRGAAQVAANVAEADLKDLSVGQKVKVELDWNQDLGVSYEGTVEMISALGTVGEESTTYPVYISFTPDVNTRYSMTAVVTTLEEGEAPAAPAEAEETEDAYPADPEAETEGTMEQP